MSPNPNWQVTVQSPSVLPNGKAVPGFVQVDDISNGVNAWSKSPAQLKAEGYDIREDFSRLPQGKYSFGLARGLLHQEEQS